MLTTTPKIPSIRKATLINLAGLVLPVLTGLITVPLYLRWIGDTRYGVLLLAFTFLGYFGAFDFGLGRSVAKNLAAENSVHHGNRVFWTALMWSGIFGTIGAIILYAIGIISFPYVSDLSGRLQTEAINGMPWLAATVPIMALTSVTAGTLESRHAFLSLNIGLATGAIALQTLPLLMILMGYGTINNLIEAALSGRFLGFIVMFVATIKYLPLTKICHLNLGETKNLMKFGGWISLSGMVLPILNMADRLIIGWLMGAAMVTSYVVPYNLIIKLTYLPQALSTTLFPRFATQNSEERRTSLHKGIINIFRYQSPFVSMAIILSYPFLDLWVNPGFSRHAAPLLIIFSVIIFFINPSYIPYIMLQASGKPHLAAKFQLIELLPFIILVYYLIKQLGVTGAALAWALRSLSESLYLTHNTNSTRTYIKQLLKNSPALLLSLGASWFFLRSDEILYMLSSIAVVSLSFFPLVKGQSYFRDTTKNAGHEP